MTFISYIDEGDLVKAISFSEKSLRQYREHPHNVKIPTKNSKGDEYEIEVIKIIGLICY